MDAGAWVLLASDDERGLVSAATRLGSGVQTVRVNAGGEEKMALVAEEIRAESGRIDIRFIAFPSWKVALFPIENPDVSEQLLDQALDGLRSSLGPILPLMLAGAAVVLFGCSLNNYDAGGERRVLRHANESRKFSESGRSNWLQNRSVSTPSIAVRLTGHIYENRRFKRMQRSGAKNLQRVSA
jgi:hypothetical protein